ncbi:MAG: Fur family transcriptional regulator [Acidobacteriota bacterium]
MHHSRKISQAKKREKKLENKMSEKSLEWFSKTCREKGLSATHQRLAIFLELARSVDHPTADSLHARIRKIYPTISLATVYRTLETLEKSGIIQRVSTADSLLRYDADSSQHNHFYCVSCHRVDDVPDSVINGFHLKEKSMRDCIITDYSVIFRGLCQECSRRKRPRREA